MIGRRPPAQRCLANQQQRRRGAPTRSGRRCPCGCSPTRSSSRGSSRGSIRPSNRTCKSSWRASSAKCARCTRSASRRCRARVTARRTRSPTAPSTFLTSHRSVRSWRGARRVSGSASLRVVAAPTSPPPTPGAPSCRRQRKVTGSATGRLSVSLSPPPPPLTVCSQCTPALLPPPPLTPEGGLGRKMVAASVTQHSPRLTWQS
mmetsp:Transcript_223/g.582  ORF Transcript_223/g.582 Transcript_223/m.582 type:complete len:204 (+) Transcript_223:1053-1664(+)